jgi:hypothetical protein
MMEEFMDKMAHVWRGMAKNDCQSSINTICESITAFPELLAWDDEKAAVLEHLGRVCELLCLDEPWGGNDGT